MHKGPTVHVGPGVAYVRHPARHAVAQHTSKLIIVMRLEVRCQPAVALRILRRDVVDGHELRTLENDVWRARVGPIMRDVLQQHAHFDVWEICLDLEC